MLPICDESDILLDCLFSVSGLRPDISDSSAEDDDLLIIDNGASSSIKKIIYPFKRIVNASNMFVNFAWNQGLSYFFDNMEYTHIVLMTQDVIMPSGWRDCVSDAFKKNFCNDVSDIFLFDVVDDRCEMMVERGGKTRIELRDNRQMPLILLNRGCAQKVYPIPRAMRILFGSEYILTKLRLLDMKTWVYADFCAYYSQDGVERHIESKFSVIANEDVVRWPFVMNDVLFDIDRLKYAGFKFCR